jgi:hypothetical protein
VYSVLVLGVFSVFMNAFILRQSFFFTEVGRYENDRKSTHSTNSARVWGRWNGLVRSSCIHGRVPCVGVIEADEAVDVNVPGIPDEAVGVICVRFGLAAVPSSWR